MNLRDEASKIFITGGAGFLGTIVLEMLLAKGYQCVSMDLHPHSIEHPALTTIQGDISYYEQLLPIFEQHQFSAIIHCAALLAHGSIDKNKLWDANVVATEHIAALAVKYHIKKIIFTSSNCLWAENLHRMITEEDFPRPIELYGKSKLAAEKILMAYQDKIQIIIFRCPTIIDAGRMGLLAILFEFIKEGRKVYVVGKGDNQYQFIYAQDLANAIFMSLSYNKSNIFNIGSDNVKSLYDVFAYVIKKAGTGARMASLPKSLTLNMMKLAYLLGLSPLGPYHYKMIAEDFIFDTKKIKKELGWQPTLTNEEMLWQGYQYYLTNSERLSSAQSVSAHKKPAKMGMIRLLKWIS